MQTTTKTMKSVHAVTRRCYSFNSLSEVNHLNLKRIPIPTLEDTLQRYEEGAKHFCKEGEWENHQSLISDFLKQAKDLSLQEKLLAAEVEAEKKGKPHFHFEEHWDDMYLDMRCSCPINSNPYYIFEDMHDGCQASSAARVTHSAIQWWINCKNGLAEVETNKAGSLCMGTFPTIIATSRIPGTTRDVIEAYPDATHVIAIFKGQFYKVEAVGKTVSELHSSFNAIMKDGNDRDQGNVAILTSTERTKWAANRSKLMSASIENEQSIKTIDKGLFTVSLDTYNTTPSIETLCQSHLTGLFSESEKTVSNRWWDKIGFTIDNNSTTGLVMEHAPADGAYWNSWLEGTTKYYNQTIKQTSTSSNSSQWEHLPVSEDPSMIQDAEAEFKNAADAVDLSVSYNKDLSAARIKSAGFSADAFIQVSAQVAYHNINNTFAGTYESASMRNFWRGRTETIRSSQSTIPKLIDGLHNNFSIELLDQACAKQTQVTKMALQGKGIDRHLLSLRKLYESNTNGTAHELFSSTPFIKSSEWLLSTSNVTSDWLHQFGFGAVTQQGYGLGYQTKADVMTCTISSYEEGKSKKFETELIGTMEKLLDLKVKSA